MPAFSPYQTPKLATGMAAPMGQKTIQPAPVAPATPAQLPGMDFSKFSTDYENLANSFGGSLTTGFNNNRTAQMFRELGKLTGFQGDPLQKTQYNATTMGEGGEYTQNMSGFKVDPAFAQQMADYRVQSAPDKVNATLYNPTGASVGNFQSGDKSSGLDRFLEKAVPLGLGALAGGAAFGALGGGAAAPAAAASAAPGLGLAESVYGLGGALGSGAVPGTVGGLAGSTTAFGGLGSFLPAGVGFGEALAFGAASGLGMDLSTVGGPDPAGLVPNNLSGPPVGNGEFLGEAPFTPTQPPAAGFNAAADSQLASSQLGITGQQAAAAATAPASVNLGSAGGSLATGGSMIDKIGNALSTAFANPGQALAGAGSGLIDFAKANPALAASAVGGIGTLLGGSPSLPNLNGGAASGGSLAPGAQGVANNLGAVNFSGIPNLQTTAGDPNASNQQAIDAAYSQQTRYLDPQIQQQQRELESRLAEQGFVPGTPAYNQAMTNFMDTNQRAYGAARDSSILRGYQIGQGQFQNAATNTNINNLAATQALSRYLAERNQPINERNALLNGDQMVNNNKIDLYNAQVGESNSRNSALSQLALALGMYLG